MFQTWPRARKHPTDRILDAVTRAVVDLPTAAVRRHLHKPGGRLPAWLVGDAAAETRALVT